MAVDKNVQWQFSPRKVMTVHQKPVAVHPCFVPWRCHHRYHGTAMTNAVGAAMGSHSTVIAVSRQCRCHDRLPHHETPCQGHGPWQRHVKATTVPWHCHEGPRQSHGAAMEKLNSVHAYTRATVRLTDHTTFQTLAVQRVQGSRTSDSESLDFESLYYG